MLVTSSLYVMARSKKASSCGLEAIDWRLLNEDFGCFQVASANG
jgi:hypothetical protein